MKSQMILEIDASVEFDEMPHDLQTAIRKAGIEWPESTMIGTSSHEGKKLILIQTSVDADTLTNLMNSEIFDDNGNQIAFNLGWQVLASDKEPINQSALLPYFDDVPVYDDEGNFNGFEPVTDLTGKLQTWAGKQWQY